MHGSAQCLYKPRPWIWEHATIAREHQPHLVDPKHCGGYVEPRLEKRNTLLPSHRVETNFMANPVVTHDRRISSSESGESCQTTQNPGPCPSRKGFTHTAPSYRYQPALVPGGGSNNNPCIELLQHLTIGSPVDGIRDPAKECLYWAIAKRHRKSNCKSTKNDSLG